MHLTTFESQVPIKEGKTRTEATLLVSGIGWYSQEPPCHLLRDSYTSFA